jgi:pimeloyl-ACP methyl ester carboxylesterase
MTFLTGGFALAAALTGVAQQNRPAGPPPGRLVDIGSRALHIHCLGPEDGRPAVVFEAGAGDYSNRWAAVQQLLGPRIRSCAYDRAGFGWSTGAPESMSQDTADLRALLKAANVAGPYVLVGHSLGGLLVRRYAHHYPDAVSGMVLVDAAHENTRLFFTSDNQWKRVREQPIPIGADFQELYRARQSNPVPLGDRPLIVVDGTRPDPKVTRPEDVEREKAAEPEDLARISRNSKLVLDPSSGHRIHVENPNLVAKAIEEVVTAAMKGATLTRPGKS